MGMVTSILVAAGTVWLAALTGLIVYVGLKIRARFQHLDGQLTRLSDGLYRRLSSQLAEALEDKTQEVQNAVALAQIGFRYPLFLAGWSIDSFLGKFLAQHLLETPPKLILELGSGSSTLLIARCLEQLGYKSYRHIVVDHDSRYLELTRKFLQVNNLEEMVEYWDCPLRPVEGVDQRWYSGLTDRLDHLAIDLLIVDGPPGRLQGESRYPALPKLYPFLADHCTVVLDDAGRADELSIVRKWGERYPELSAEYFPPGHGFAVLRR